jgi:hypothetical protein
MHGWMRGWLRKRGRALVLGGGSRFQHDTRYR